MIINIQDIPINCCGIYKIEYENGKIYIGQSTNIRKRALEHNSKQKYPCDLALKKYAAKIIILEETNPEDLDNKESFYISYFESYKKDKGYNIVLQGNASGKRGVENINASFTKEQLDDIVDLLINHTELSLLDIANKYQVDQNTILKISKGQTYYQDSLQYPLRLNNHDSVKKDSILDYFSTEEELINLKEDLKYRWDLTVEQDLTNKYNIPLKILRDINNGRKFEQYGNYEYPIRKKNIRNNAQLTVKDVEDILNLLRNTKQSMSEIGTKYHLYRDTISKINQGTAYIIKDYDYPARIK